MKKQIPCKFVKREGEGCTANNNCKYPNCPSPDLFEPIRGEPWYGFTQEDLDSFEKAWDDYAKKNKPRVDKWLWSKLIKFLKRCK